MNSLETKKEALGEIAWHVEQGARKIAADHHGRIVYELTTMADAELGLAELPASVRDAVYALANAMHPHFVEHAKEELLTALTSGKEGA